jgi:hypothetical protein
MQLRGGDGVSEVCECCQGDETNIEGRIPPEMNTQLGHVLCWECEATINWWMEVTA